MFCAQGARHLRHCIADRSADRRRKHGLACTKTSAGKSHLRGEIGDWNDEYLMEAPDLVVEVLSPGNTVDEIIDKMSTCMSNGCLSFWVVDAKRKRVSVTEGDVTRHYGIDTSVSSELIGVSIPVGEIFP